MASPDRGRGGLLARAAGRAACRAAGAASSGRRRPRSGRVGARGAYRAAARASWTGRRAEVAFRRLRPGAAPGAGRIRPRRRWRQHRRVGAEAALSAAALRERGAPGHQQRGERRRPSEAGSAPPGDRALHFGALALRHGRFLRVVAALPPGPSGAVSFDCVADRARAAHPRVRLISRRRGRPCGR